LQLSLHFTHFHQFWGGFINYSDRNICLVWGNQNCMFVDRTTAMPRSSDKKWHPFSYSSFSGKAKNTRGAMFGLYGRCFKTVKPRWWMPAFSLLLWGHTSLCCIKTCCMSGQALEISCLKCLQYSSVALRLNGEFCMHNAMNIVESISSPRLWWELSVAVWGLLSYAVWSVNHFVILVSLVICCLALYALTLFLELFIDIILESLVCCSLSLLISYTVRS
jgi:hypothetical protein